MLKIVLYKKTDFEDFKHYIRKSFHKKYILGYKKFLDWQYNGQLYLVKKGNEIIGHFGFRDVMYKVYDKIQPIRVLMNLFVLEPYRLSGVAVLLTKRVFNTQNPLFVSGYTLGASKLFSHLHSEWRDVGNLERYMAILDPRTSLFSKYSIPDIRTRRTTDSDITVEKLSNFDDSLEEVWNRVRARYAVTVERTNEYFSWRFLKHPFFKYKFLMAKNGVASEGYLVWRIEEDQGFKMARIIDLVATEQAEMPLLLKFLDCAKKEGAAAADFLFSGKLYKRALLDSGFFNTTGTDLEKFPIWFNPISYKKTFVNIGYNLNAPFTDCYFTKADGDQDRPNPH